MSDGSIVIDTRLDSSEFEKGISGIKKTASTGAKVVAAAIATIGTAIGGLAISVFNVGKDFESAFAGVKKTVDATDEQLAKLRNGIRDMAKSMPPAATEIAGVAEAAGQLGIKTDNILGFTKTMVMLGDSTNMSANDAATALARLANITGMPQTAFDRLGSVVVALGNNLATTESEIVEMGLRLAGAGHQVGMSESQILSFAGALSSVGINAEAGGSAFSKVMIDMQLATQKGGKDLENFAKVSGMSASQFKQAFEKDATGAIIAFIQGLGNCEKNGQSAIGVLDSMGIKEVILRDALLRAAGASDVFSNAVDIGTQAWDKNVALTNEANQRYETMESKLKILKNNIVDVGISVYDKFEKPLREAFSVAIESVKKLADNMKSGELSASIDKIAEGFSNLIIAVSNLIVEILPKLINCFAWLLDNGSTIISIVAGITAAIATFKTIGIITDVIKAWQTATLQLALYAAGSGNATIAQGVLNGAFTLGETLVALLTGKITLATVAQKLWNLVMAANPIGILVTLIAGLVAGFIMLWNTSDGFRQFWINLWNSIKQSCLDAWNGIIGFFTETIPSWVENIKLWFQNLPEYFSILWEDIKQFFINGWNSIVNFFTETIPTWIESIAEWFGQLPGKIGYALGYVLATIIKWGVNTWTYLVTNVPIWIDGIINWFKGLPGKIWTWLVNTLNKLTTWGVQMQQKAYTAALNAINAIINWFKQLPGKIWTWLTNTISKLATFASQMGTKAKEAASNFVTWLIDGVKSLPGKMAAIGTDIVKGIWNGIKNMGSWLMGKVGDFFSGIVDGAKDALGIHSPSRVMAKDVGRWIPPGISVGIEKTMPKLKKEFAKDIQNLTSKMKATVDFETSEISTSITTNSDYKASKERPQYIENNNENGITQHNYFYDKVKSPSETTRALKRLNRGIAYDI